MSIRSRFAAETASSAANRSNDARTIIRVHVTPDRQLQYRGNAAVGRSLPGAAQPPGFGARFSMKAWMASAVSGCIMFSAITRPVWA